MGVIEISVAKLGNGKNASYPIERINDRLKHIGVNAVLLRRQVSRWGE